MPAARPLRTVTTADTSCAALLQWEPIRVPYQNHEDELVSERTDISPEEVSRVCVRDVRKSPPARTVLPFGSKWGRRKAAAGGWPG